MTTTLKPSRPNAVASDSPATPPPTISTSRLDSTSETDITTSRTNTGDFRARSGNHIQHGQREVPWRIEQRPASVKDYRKQVRATGNEALLSYCLCQIRPQTIQVA